MMPPMRRWGFRILFCMSMMPLVLVSLLWLQERAPVRYFLPEGFRFYLPTRIDARRPYPAAPHKSYRTIQYCSTGIAYYRIDSMPIVRGPDSDSPQFAPWRRSFPGHSHRWPGGFEHFYEPSIAYGTFPDDPLVPRTEFEGYTSSTTIPHWFIVTITSLLPISLILRCLAAMRRQRLAQRRLREGRCIACGYDLRGGSSRCPECGTAKSRQQQPYIQPPSSKPTRLDQCWRFLQLFVSAIFFTCTAIVVLAAVAVDMVAGARLILILYGSGIGIIALAFLRMHTKNRISAPSTPSQISEYTPPHATRLPLQ
jgi:hypothetical protein